MKKMYQIIGTLALLTIFPKFIYYVNSMSTKDCNLNNYAKSIQPLIDPTTCHIKIRSPQLDENQDIKHTNQLANHLLEEQNYMFDMAPIVEGKPTQVDISLHLKELINFDGISQTLSALFWVRLSWIDQRLSWDRENNRSPFSNISDISLNPSKIWTPDLTLYNAANGKHTFSEDSQYQQVYTRINHQGIVQWTPMVAYQISCPMILKYFPFDIQACMIKLGSWVYNVDRMRLHLIQNETDMHFFIRNEVWYVKKTFAYLRESDYGSYTDLDPHPDIYQDVKVGLVNGIRLEFRQVRRCGLVG